MENCLVTKLKGVVNNDNLPKYNTIKFGVSTPADYSPVALKSYLFFNSGKLVSATGEVFDVCNTNGVILQEGVTSYENATWFNVAFRAGKEYVFEYSPKYTYGGFGNAIGAFDLASCISLDVSDFCWSPNTQEFTIGGITNNLKLPNITGEFKLLESNNVFRKLGINCCQVKANIDDFARLTTLMNCDFYHNLAVEGSILSLQHNLGLTGLHMVGNQKVTGDLKTLAEAMVANGRTSGQIEVHGWETLLTIDGVPYNTKVKEEGENYWYVDIIFDSSLAAGYRFNYR